MNKIIVKTSDAKYEIGSGSNNLERKRKLDYVWIQKNDGTKSFYRMKPKGAELQLTTEIFEEAVKVICQNKPQQLDELLKWVEGDACYYNAMLEAYDQFMSPLMFCKLFYRSEKVQDELYKMISN